jgi:hypothetical protein
MEGCKYRIPAANIIKNNVIILFKKKTKDVYILVIISFVFFVKFYDIIFYNISHRLSIFVTLHNNFSSQ